jgi:hypothetical protein
MKIKPNIKYLATFFATLIIEVIIALYAKDNFIRAYLGDVLVVVLIYCFIKSFIKIETEYLWLYIFIFATLIEIGQYFNFVDLMGLGEYRIARIILGTTFDIRDIICYFVGCIGILLFNISLKRKNSSKIHN